MRKKPQSRSRPLARTPEPLNSVLDWRNIPEKDLYFFAQASHKAAKKLAGSLQLGLNPLGDFDAYPVLFMYRHAVELYLKAIVHEGGNFLTTKPDHLSVAKTRSVSWLAQFVVQIVTALGWEDQFRCDGIENPADFKAIIEEVNSIDSGHGMFRVSGDPQGRDSLAEQLGEFARRLDALLELLDSTADALAAEWDLRLDEAALDAGGNDDGEFGPTIQ